MNDVQLKAIVVPDNASQEIAWLSSNAKVATVNDDGIIHFSGLTGTVIITAKATDGTGKYAVTTFVVTE